IDVQIHPSDPQTLLVAAWERQRDGYDSRDDDPPMADGYDGYDPIKKWGSSSGIYKTTDGGKTWRKLTQGLPSGSMGRIGIDSYRKDPNTVFAIIDCEKIGMGKQRSNAYLGIAGQNFEGHAKLVQVAPEGPGGKAGLKVGDIIKAADKTEIKNYNQLSQL